MQLNAWVGLGLLAIAAATGCAPESLDSHWASRREANVLAAPSNEFLKLALEKSDSHDGGNENRFASAVALDGDTALIGSPCDAIGRNLCQGSVHVYVRSGNAWIFQAKLVRPDGLANERFGAAVSLQGDRALVGAPATNTVFVFVRSGESWTLEAELRASDGASIDQFGTAVSLEGDRALIGAAQHSKGVEGKGRAYVFVRSGQIWSEEAKLVAADGAVNDNFGYAVSLSADTALIGAPQHSLVDAGVGSAYVFVRSGSSWTEQGKLLGTGDARGFFGTSVALDVDTAVVGASGCTEDYCDIQGKAYVFSRAGAQWTRYTLSNTDWSFGTSVAVHGNEALVGAPDSTATPPFGTAGAAFLFKRSGQDWSQAAAIAGDPTEVVPTGAIHTPKFGSSVALSGDSTLVGADAVWGNGWVKRRYRGDAYVHVRSGATWERQRKLQLDYGYEALFFGSAVASDADTAIVGAPAKSDNWQSFATDQPPGFARVYLRSGADWSPQANLAAPIDPIVPTNLFGSSIAVSGDTAIVGECCSNAEFLARVFVRSGTTWTLQASLGDQRQSAGFGRVAIDGNTALVGGFVVPNTYQEMVYVFVRAGTTWTHQATLTTADSTSQFGFALALVGDLALVGAPGYVYQQPSGPYRGGSVHVFERSGESWTEQATLTRLDGDATEGKDDLFGSSLAAVGDRALVGAPRIGKGGAAYVFRRSGSAWTREADLDAGDDPSLATFGCAVALSPDVAVVGRRSSAWGIAPSQGSAHVFARSDTTWTPRAVLTAPDGFVGDEFGAAVALVGDRAMIGAPNVPGDGIYGNPNEGAVYVMSLDGARGGAGGEGGAAGSGGDDAVTGGTGSGAGNGNGIGGEGSAVDGNAGAGGNGGSSGRGAEAGSGGNDASGGTTSSDAGEPAAGTPSGGSRNPNDDEGDCSCSTPGRPSSSPALLALALAAFGVVRRRLRGSHGSSRTSRYTHLRLRGGCTRSVVTRHECGDGFDERIE